MRTKLFIFILLIGSAAGEGPSVVQALIPEIRFTEHRFSPQTLVVPAGQLLQVRVVNSSKERIEFESFDLNREKVIEPGESVTLRLPALRAGRYDFFDDFHDDVPEGVIIAK